MTQRQTQGFLGVALVVLSVLLGVLLLEGCGWQWQKTAKVTLTGHEAGLATADKVGLAYYQRTCRAIAKECPPGSDEKTCTKLGECWGKRRLLQAILDKTALAIAVGWTAVVAGDEEGWPARLAVIQEGFRDLEKHLAGIVPGGVL